MGQLKENIPSELLKQVNLLCSFVISRALNYFCVSKGAFSTAGKIFLYQALKMFVQ
jgi:hypothetical protein